MQNFIRISCDFVDDVTKTFWFEFFVSQFQFDVHLQNVHAKFDKVV